MLFCAACRVELQCAKNGFGIRFPTDHVYAGDLFRCPSCEMMVIKAAGSAVFDPGQKIETIEGREL
jgi:hypothetical protein